MCNTFPENQPHRVVILCERPFDQEPVRLYFNLTGPADDPRDALQFPCREVAEKFVEIDRAIRRVLPILFDGVIDSSPLADEEDRVVLGIRHRDHGPLTIVAYEIERISAIPNSLN